MLGRRQPGAPASMAELALQALAPPCAPPRALLRSAATLAPAAAGSCAGSWTPPLSPARMRSVLAGAALGTAAAVMALTRRGKPRRSRAVACRTSTDGAESQAPSDLYGLLGVGSNADPTDIKKAYYNMQKICHPDVAGPEGEEMCILLNDAYDVLGDSEKRSVYDEELSVTQKDDANATPEVSRDLHPTWQWRPKKHNAAPIWRGTPRSLSRWNKVKPEDKGPKHAEQQFMYVDEFSCIACRNCCDVSPKTFCIDAESGRARVYAQWGDSEEYLDYASAACPVDCIHWVGREQLQYLEHVTAKYSFDTGGQYPNPMQFLSGAVCGSPPDPFSMAKEWEETVRRKDKKRRAKENSMYAAMTQFALRIRKVFGLLSTKLKKQLLISRQ